MRPEHLNRRISKTLFLYGLFRHVMFRANVNVKSTQILYTCIPIESCLRKSLQRITLQLTYSPHKGAIYFLFATITVCLLCPLCFLCIFLMTYSLRSKKVLSVISSLPYPYIKDSRLGSLILTRTKEQKRVILTFIYLC